MSEDFDLKIEIAINRAFEKYIPRIIKECRKRDEQIVAMCPAANLFRDGDMVKAFREIEFNYRRNTKKQAYIIGAVVTLLNGVILLAIKHFL